MNCCTEGHLHDNSLGLLCLSSGWVQLSSIRETMLRLIGSDSLHFAFVVVLPKITCFTDERTTNGQTDRRWPRLANTWNNICGARWLNSDPNSRTNCSRGGGIAKTPISIGGHLDTSSSSPWLTVTQWWTGGYDADARVVKRSIRWICTQIYIGRLGSGVALEMGGFATSQMVN